MRYIITTGNGNFALLHDPMFVLTTKMASFEVKPPCT